jgi:GTP-binding protein HflX
MLATDARRERAFLVGADVGRAATGAAESIDELALLCETAGAEVCGRLVCRLASVNAALFIGSGKAQEVADLAQAAGATTIVFDDDLSPAQARNLEKIVALRVVDRTQLILDIFAQHARTREGRMQIELAQLEYLLPRLKRMWTHLERQKGGIGLRGPGETQLEMDRRRIEVQIRRLKDGLEQVRSHRSEQRRGRRRHGWALISLVGYTNAGKSTLLNRLTGAGVLAHDQLFATLDPTTRQLRLPNHQPALLTDTVGFIRKLPHDLVDSFRATLEEVVEADILIHVVDAAHPRVYDQVAAVNAVLRDLGAADKTIVHVLNKMDLEGAQLFRPGLEDILSHPVAISARTGEGVDAMLDLLADLLRRRSVRMRLRIPLAEGKLLAAIFASGTVHAKEYEEDSVRMEASLPARLAGACAPFDLDAPPPVADDAD